MTDSLPYDYTSWQFLDAVGQASPLQPQPQTDEAMSFAMEFPSHGRSDSDYAFSSDNCLPYGLNSAKAAMTGSMHKHMHSPPIEMGMGMNMDMEMDMFAQGMEFISIPPYPDLTLTLGHGKKAPDTMTDLSLLRCASQNATERALFMTPSGIASPSSSSSSSSSSPSNRHSSTPLLDPCTPSTTTSKESDEDGDCDWDEPSLGLGLDFYKLPDPDRVTSDYSFQSIPRPPRHVHHHSHRVNTCTHRDEDTDADADAEADADALTPLEMPDGSTRFTANWLPVDPTGGFTIGSEEGRGRSASSSASASVSSPVMESSYGYGHGYSQDHAYGHAYADAYGYGDDPLSMEFSKEAFIQMPMPV